jgi:hypothetical protein
MTRSAQIRPASALLAAVATFVVAYLTSTILLVLLTAPKHPGVNPFAAIVAQVSLCLLAAVLVGRLVLRRGEAASK